MIHLIVHLDTETTGLDPVLNGVHSLGYIGEVLAETDDTVMSNVEYLGYWEFNPVGRQRDPFALTVGHVNDEILDSRCIDLDVCTEIRDTIDGMIHDFKSRYPTGIVVMLGSNPMYDVRMIDGMCWDWKMDKWFRDGENIVDLKYLMKDLEALDRVKLQNHKLQNFIDEMTLRDAVESEMSRLHTDTSYVQKGNANPFDVTRPHTAIYDCVCGMVAHQRIVELAVAEEPSTEGMGA